MAKHLKIECHAGLDGFPDRVELRSLKFIRNRALATAWTMKWKLLLVRLLISTRTIRPGKFRIDRLMAAVSNAEKRHTTRRAPEDGKEELMAMYKKRTILPSK